MKYVTTPVKKSVKQLSILDLGHFLMNELSSFIVTVIVRSRNIFNDNICCKLKDKFFVLYR